MTIRELRHVLKKNPDTKHLSSSREVVAVAPLVVLNEQVEDAMYCTGGEYHSMILVTDRRVLFGGWTRGFSRYIDHHITHIIKFEEIESVEFVDSVVPSILTILTPWIKLELQSFQKFHASRIAALIRQKVDSAREAFKFEPPDESESLSDQIVRLAELHASGVLTDVEFAAAKAKLLGL